MDENFVIKDGIKYRLVPEKPVEPLLEPSSLEKEEEITENSIELVDTTPKKKSPREYLIKTAQTLANSRVQRVIEESKERRAYEAKVGNIVKNSNTFYGEGSTNAGKESDEDI